MTPETYLAVWIFSINLKLLLDLVSKKNLLI